MTSATLSVFATAETEGVNLRIFTLLLASAIAGAIGGCLTFIITSGNVKKKLAASVIAGFIAFAGAYKFLDSLVPSHATSP